MQCEEVELTAPCLGFLIFIAQLFFDIQLSRPWKAPTDAKVQGVAMEGTPAVLDDLEKVFFLKCAMFKMTFQNFMFETDLKPSFFGGPLCVRTSAT